MSPGYEHRLLGMQPSSPPSRQRGERTPPTGPPDQSEAERGKELRADWPTAATQRARWPEELIRRRTASLKRGMKCFGIEAEPVRN